MKHESPDQVVRSLKTNNNYQEHFPLPANEDKQIESSVLTLSNVLYTQILSNVPVVPWEIQTLYNETEKEGKKSNLEVEPFLSHVVNKTYNTSF